MKISKYFHDYEFRCHCGKCNTILPPKELLDVLDDVREHFGRPTIVMSGHRCKKHNRRVGGARRSRHVVGDASDIIVSGVNPKRVQRYLLRRYPNSYGIGKYGTFTHVDTRPYKARWGKWTRS